MSCSSSSSIDYEKVLAANGGSSASWNSRDAVSPQF